MALNSELQCKSCGRNFSGYAADADIYAGAPCPVIDDCPEHFEEKGIAHPDHARAVGA